MRTRVVTTTCGVVAVLCTWLAASGCSSPKLPQPSPNPSGPAPAVPASAVSMLEISRLTVTQEPNAAGVQFGYYARFWLTETSGKSGATIQNIEVSAGGDSENIGPGCWRSPIRVEPGGTLDIFAGERVAAYCAPEASSQGVPSVVSVVVTFTDDEGRTGTATARATVTK